ncbi:hypothetical protein EGH10_12795 [Brevibacillus laterosporus]|nr:hypothetical protein DM460_21960 [Brevibacillus laterosporus]TPH10564.1 hypothetical protein EGH10_12795 [Brevibacillus laterosporus]
MKVNEAPMKLIRRALEAFFFWLWVLVKGGESIMPFATIYVYLILDGDKTYPRVPIKIRPEVKRQLTVLGYEELATNSAFSF